MRSRSSLFILLFLLCRCSTTDLFEVRRSGSATLKKSDFTVQVFTRWENSDLDPQLVGECVVDEGEKRGTEVECPIRIPEGQLFFGELQFRVKARVEGCAQMIFHPFYYLESRSPSFQRTRTDAAIDCSKDEIPKECYNGPAPDLVEGWPEYTGKYVNLSTAREAEFTIPSANSKMRNNNRWIVNDLDDSLRGESFRGFVGGTMRNWGFQCRDKYSEILRHITVKFSDIDAPPDTEGVDNFSGWPKPN